MQMVRKVSRMPTFLAQTYTTIGLKLYLWLNTMQQNALFKRPNKQYSVVDRAFLDIFRDHKGKGDSSIVC